MEIVSRAIQHLAASVRNHVGTSTDGEQWTWTEQSLNRPLQNGHRGCCLGSNMSWHAETSKIKTLAAMYGALNPMMRGNTVCGNRGNVAAPHSFLFLILPKPIWRPARAFINKFDPDMQPGPRKCQHQPASTSNLQYKARHLPKKTAQTHPSFHVLLLSMLSPPEIVPVPLGIGRGKASLVWAANA